MTGARRRHHRPRPMDRRRRRSLLPVRRLLTGADPDLGTWHAFRQYFSGVDDRRLWVLFEEDFLPGYAWVFPVGDGRANVGFGVLRDGSSGAAPTGKALAAQWRTLVDRPSVRRALGDHAQPEGTHRAWPIPASYDRARLAHGRALFVGDAANVVDPMTGEGHRAGARDRRARGARHRASPGDAEAVARRYCDDVDRALGADLKFAALLQHILRAARRARRDRRRRAHAVDAPELRPLDVRGLSPCVGVDPRGGGSGAFTGPGQPIPTPPRTLCCRRPSRSTAGPIRRRTRGTSPRRCPRGCTAWRSGCRAWRWSIPA